MKNIIKTIREKTKTESDESHKQKNIRSNFSRTYIFLNIGKFVLLMELVLDTSFKSKTMKKKSSICTK